MSFFKFLYVIDAFSFVPSISSVVRIKSCPLSSSAFPSTKSQSRISGPFVSKRVATGKFNSLLILITFASFCFCSSCVPCEKLNLATFIPASINSLKVSSFSLAGPIVQIIFVFLILLFPPFQNVYRIIISLSKVECNVYFLTIHK